MGVFSCGQHFRRQDTLILSVVDFGQGMPGKIRSFFRKHAKEELVSKMTGASCLRWAFQAGNTTKVGEPGGSGLDLLKEFVRINQGSLKFIVMRGMLLLIKTAKGTKIVKYLLKERLSTLPYAVMRVFTASKVKLSYRLNKEII